MKLLRCSQFAPAPQNRHIYYVSAVCPGGFQNFKLTIPSIGSTVMHVLFFGFNHYCPSHRGIEIPCERGHRGTINPSCQMSVLTRHCTTQAPFNVHYPTMQKRNFPRYPRKESTKNQLCELQVLRNFARVLHLQTSTIWSQN